MTAFIFIIGGLILAGVLYLVFRPTTETIVTIKSNYGATATNGAPKTYVAKKKKNRNGYSHSDWDYYDDLGNLIEDLILIELLYGVFEDEDWYGDYDFYVEDEGYYNEVLAVEDVQNEENIMNSVEEVEPTPIVVDTPVEETPIDETPVVEETPVEDNSYEDKPLENDYEDKSFESDYQERSFDSDYSSSSSSYDSGGSDFGGGGFDD